MLRVTYLCDVFQLLMRPSRKDQAICFRLNDIPNTTKWNVIQLSWVCYQKRRKDFFWLKFQGYICKFPTRQNGIDSFPHWFIGCKHKRKNLVNLRLLTCGPTSSGKTQVVKAKKYEKERRKQWAINTKYKMKRTRGTAKGRVKRRSEMRGGIHEDNTDSEAGCLLFCDSDPQMCVGFAHCACQCEPSGNQSLTEAFNIFRKGTISKRRLCSAARSRLR